MNLVKKISLFFLIWLVFLVSSRKLSENNENAEGKSSIRQKFVAVTSFTIIVALLIMLVSPKRNLGRGFGIAGRCPVCDHALLDRGRYCSECGSRV